MLFNSYEFIFAFLPLVLLGFYLLEAIDRPKAIIWLGCASIFFYGWWDWRFVPLLAASVIFNFVICHVIIRADERRAFAAKRFAVICGIGMNLAALAYFKYTNFFIENLRLVLDYPLTFAHVLLPIGISFFSFTQIAFLADTYREPGAIAPRFRNYLLFVTYFPHLIAGPILHHKEMMPQFERNSLSFPSENIAVGISIFIIGLFKKVVIADGVALFATPMFNAAAHGLEPSLVEAWCGALAYTFQLYFDFSGYSDMAVGLSRMLGIRLPLNFDSPYKATSIIDFWRRWHMTLSRFLRDYVYIALGGNRRGAARRYVNLMITMLLGGMWHGAGWTYILWGGLHGSYLVINNLWHGLRRKQTSSSALGRGCGRLLTFLSVVVAWVFFRADSLDAALIVVKGMIGLNGIALPRGYLGWLGPVAPTLQSFGVRFEDAMPFFTGIQELGCLLVLLVIVWFLPNTQEITRNYRPALNLSSVTPRLALIDWRPAGMSVWLIALLAVGSLLSLTKVSPFLYFQF